LAKSSITEISIFLHYYNFQGVRIFGRSHCKKQLFKHKQVCHQITKDMVLIAIPTPTVKTFRFLTCLIVWNNILQFVPHNLTALLL